MDTTRPDQPGQGLHHDHPTRPRNQCPSCTQRFGMVVTSTTEISKMLSQHKDVEYAEAGALIQLVFTLNKQLDRVANALEKMAGDR